jgi:hypothetical protein
VFVYGLGLRLCLKYVVVVWLGFGTLFVGMYILRANLGLFVWGVGCEYCMHWLVPKNKVFMLACNAWVMRCTALSCCVHVILRPFKEGFLHVDNR